LDAVPVPTKADVFEHAQTVSLPGAGPSQLAWRTTDSVTRSRPLDTVWYQRFSGALHGARG